MFNPNSDQKAEHPSLIVWTKETFRAELKNRVENEK